MSLTSYLAAPSRDLKSPAPGDGAIVQKKRVGVKLFFAEKEKKWQSTCPGEGYVIRTLSSRLSETS